MATDPRLLGHRIAASLLKHVWQNPRHLWHDVFRHWTEHIREHMDLWEVVRPVHSSAQFYAVPNEDVFLFVDSTASGNGYTVQLPASPVEGQTVVVIDSGRDVGAGNVITVEGAGNRVNGSSSYDIDDAGGSLLLVFDGTEWHSVGGGGGGGGGGVGTTHVQEDFDIVSDSDDEHTLADTPIQPALVYLNGQLLREGAGYSISLNTITLHIDVEADDWLSVVYYT